MFRLLRSLCGLLLVIVQLAGCGRLEAPGPEQPLIVGLPADPIFQQAAAPSEGMEGYSRDLTALFAQQLNADVRYVTAPDYPALLAMVRDGKVHFAAGVPAFLGDPQLRYTPPLRTAWQLIVRHASSLRFDDPEKLAGREIAVMPGAPQIEAIRRLAIEPAPIVNTFQGGDELELLAAVARRRHDLAATDELHFTIASNLYPDLDIAFELSDLMAYVWAFHVEGEPLREQAVRFIEEAERNGTLRQLNDRYFGHIHRLDTRDIEGFLNHVRTRLPNFRHAFQEAQEITGIDWRLLAALAYQESQWDPLATSPTGVRGMMMLTEETADRMKINNRLDAQESIRAGAKYLSLLMDNLPPDIRQPDRLWLALAAYNLGMGHLNGARHFAPSLKRDPNLWVDMKQVLPLMARPEYYQRLKSGRARGGEAVILVENIRNYFDILSRLEPVWTPPSLGEEAPPRARRPVSAQRG